MRFKPGHRVPWSRDDAYKEDLVVTLPVADETLYRNTCSTILDADRFPHFALYDADVVAGGAELADCPIAVGAFSSLALFTWLLGLSWAAERHIVVELDQPMESFTSTKMGGQISVA